MAERPRKKARAGYMISAVAELYQLHPQTLRLYERVGLLKPSRSQGNTRLYTDSDLERLEVRMAGIRIASHGALHMEALADAAAKMKQPEFGLTIDLKLGKARASIMTCDFSYDYVKINAEYTT